MIKTEKTGKLISEMVDHHGCDMWPERFKVLVAESDEELTEICLKAHELDRREQGCKVLTESVKGHKYLMCGHCGDLAQTNYCGNCGTKLIWGVSE